MCLFDVVAGYTISIVAAKRDLSVAPHDDRNGRKSLLVRTLGRALRARAGAVYLPSSMRTGGRVVEGARLESV